MADFVSHTNCPKCGSSDANATYSDNSTYCFSCKTNAQNVDLDADQKPTIKKARGTFTPLVGVYQDLPDRKLYEATLRKFGYSLAIMADGKRCHVADLFDQSGHLVAQKLRLAGKDFRWLGDASSAGLFGQNCWESGGKRLVITEGELDALSYAQATGLQTAVVSLPSGASGAVKALRKSLEFVESFDEIVLLFDADEAGTRAALECVEILPPSRVKIAKMPMKDASELLQAGRVRELLDSVLLAKTYRPDGVLMGSEIDLAALMVATPPGFSLPFPELSEMMHGIRKRELVVLTAGAGIGKTTLAREIGYHLIKEHKQRIGWVMLEESLTKSAQALVALDCGVPVGYLTEQPDLITLDQWQSSYDELVAPSAFYDAWGSSAVDNIILKMRYLAVGTECDFIVLDHVSIVVSGLEGDDRKALDILMSRIRSEICEATGVGVIAISHLRRNAQKESFNEGGQVSLTDLRGSAGIEQLSDFIIAAERDQQSDNPCATKLRILKNRPFGGVGLAGHCEYIPTTGRLVATEADESAAPVFDF